MPTDLALTMLAPHMRPDEQIIMIATMHHIHGSYLDEMVAIDGTEPDQRTADAWINILHDSADWESVRSIGLAYSETGIIENKATIVGVPRVITVTMSHGAVEFVEEKHKRAIAGAGQWVQIFGKLQSQEEIVVPEIFFCIPKGVAEAKLYQGYPNTCWGLISWSADRGWYSDKYPPGNQFRPTKT